MPRFLAVLLLAALLLSPAAAPAQTPTFAKVPPRSISIQVTFASASVADVDALGVNFDLLPLSAPHQYLRYATSNIVQQVYITLTRRHASALAIVPITVSDGLPITTAVDAKVPDYRSVQNGQDLATELLGFFQLHGKLTLTPYITLDNLIALDINASNSKDKPIRFRAIPSGSSLVIAVPNVQGTDTPVLGSVYRLWDSLPKTDELLIFLTPTIGPVGPVRASAPKKTLTLYFLNGDLREVVAKVVSQMGINNLLQKSPESDLRHFAGP